MTQDNDASTGRIREAVIGRYSGLARTAMAGGAPIDCDPDAVADRCFGAAAYPDAGDAPEAALRASLGCGNPLAVASLQPGETVLDLGSGGGLDVLLSARRVGPAGTAYGLDGSTTCSLSPAPTRRRPGSSMRAFCKAISRTSRFPMSASMW